MREGQAESGSTYHEVIKLAESQENLLDRLHRFVLGEELVLQRPHWHGDVAVALSNILYRLLAALDGDRSLEAWKHAVQRARPFRQRLAQEARRSQQAERRAARLCVLPEFLEVFGSAPEVAAGLRGEVDEQEARCWADLPEPVAQLIEAHLHEVRERLLSKAEMALEQSSTTKTRRRRLEIFAVLRERLLGASTRAFLADQLDPILASVSAREAARHLATRAQKRLSSRTLENEVSRVKSELRRLKPWLSREEQRLRLKDGLTWVARLVLEHEENPREDPRNDE